MSRSRPKRELGVVTDSSVIVAIKARTLSLSDLVRCPTSRQAAIMGGRRTLASLVSGYVQVPPPAVFSFCDCGL